ncbi:MAG: translation elongation factor Ts [Bacteroidia bacterium]|nr:translation elongation factor Ts [Bacteroidia bacterium]
MTTISASDVNKLRQVTGAGMMDCKKALVEAGGDFDNAIELLRKKGQKISLNRADRQAHEGAVIALTSADNKSGVIVELNCETDFVAKNQDFVSFANEIANLALTQKPADIAALKALKIGSLTVEQRIMDEMGKTGEKLDISSYEKLEGENIVPYIHAGNRIGVLVSLNNTPSSANQVAGKDVAMQIAAMNPIALDENSVPDDVKQREINVGKEQAIQEGKPAEMAEKIALGRLTKFYKEYTLVNQEFVKDSSKNIKKMLADTEQNLAVVGFKRVGLGA